MFCRAVFLLIIWLQAATMINAFGGSNIFGVFRKRRRTLQEMHEKRVALAVRRGFAGPHGEILTVKEYQTLQQERGTRVRQQDDQGEEDEFGVWDQFLNVLERFYARS